MKIRVLRCTVLLIFSFVSLNINSSDEVAAQNLIKSWLEMKKNRDEILKISIKNYFAIDEDPIFGRYLDEEILDGQLDVETMEANENGFLTILGKLERFSEREICHIVEDENKMFDLTKYIKVYYWLDNYYREIGKSNANLGAKGLTLLSKLRKSLGCTYTGISSAIVLATQKKLRKYIKKKSSMPVQPVGVDKIILAIEKAYAISYAENSDQLGLIFSKPESLVAENKRKIFNEGILTAKKYLKKQTFSEIKREIKEKYQRKIFQYTQQSINIIKEKKMNLSDCKFLRLKIYEMDIFPENLKDWKINFKDFEKRAIDGLTQVKSEADAQNNLRFIFNDASKSLLSYFFEYEMNKLPNCSMLVE
jgi:hypothetical protein